jgi:GDSL-like lipase/acylhydrolase family protein
MRRSLLVGCVLLMAVLSASCGNKPATSTTKPSPTVVTSQAPPNAAMPVVSRGAPAFATNAIYRPDNGNDSDYGTQFRGALPASLAYDLSQVKPVQRGRVMVAWYNEETIWDADAINGRSYNEPKDYTIDGSRASGGGTQPADGWVTLVRVSGNHFNSRLHPVDLTGFNWIRMSVTAVNGSPGNSDAAFNLDVHDAADTGADAWWFFGDSITQDDMSHRGPGATFAQQVHAALPTHFPAQQDGGIGGWDSAAPLQVDPTTHQQYFAEFLAVFPGRYVSMALGTNDASKNIAPQAFYANMAKMVEAVLQAGKVPIVPLIPWGCTPAIAENGPKINGAIRQLWAAYPQVLRGPDLWSYFEANKALMARDCIHPSIPEGATAYRRLYAKTMLRDVYRVSDSP